MGHKVSAIILYKDLSSEIALELITLHKRKTELEAKLRALFFEAPSHKAIKPFLGYDPGQADVTLTFGENALTAVYNLREKHEPKLAPLYIPESTINALLHSKLYTDAEKRAILGGQFPQLASTLSSPVDPAGNK